MNKDNYYLEIALQTLKIQRNRLYEDTLNVDYEVFCALHREKSEGVIIDLYLQKYLLIWLDRHWNVMCELIEKKTALNRTEKNKILSSFAEVFLLFIDNQCEGIINKNYEAQKYFLKQKKNLIKELLNVTDKWDKNVEQLKLDELKRDKDYKKLIKKYEGEDLL